MSARPSLFVDAVHRCCSSVLLVRTINLQEESLFAEPSFAREGHTHTSTALRALFPGGGLSITEHGNKWSTTRPFARSKERVKNHAALLDIVTNKSTTPVLKQESFYGKRASKNARALKRYSNFHDEPLQLTLCKRSTTTDN